MSEDIRNGWHRLSNGYDIEFRHGIPVRLSDNGSAAPDSESQLYAEIAALAGLPVVRATWVAGERPGEREAPLFVDDRELTEVLRRLARSSAALFVDRYHKAVDEGDVDWDRLEYLKDFNAALAHCQLAPDAVDQEACFDDYAEAMHLEARRLARERTAPPVEPE